MRTALVGLIVALSGCGPFILGDGSIVRETRSVSGFTRVRVEDGLRARLTPGPPSLVVVIDRNLLPEVLSAVEGDTLVLRVRDLTSVSPSAGAISEITAPALSRAEASGGAELELMPPSGSELRLEASGGSTLTVTCPTLERAEIVASGGSEVSLCGVARVVDVEASGGSRVLSGAATETLALDVSGGSRLEAVATVSASGAASGGSTVVIQGNPASRSVSSSGGSTVTFR